MPQKGEGACKGGVTEGDTVNVPIQKKEGDTRLVLTVRASELTLDRGDVKASATIEFTVKRTHVPKGRKQIQLTHALVDNECEKLNTSVFTIYAGTPPQRVVRLWMVSFKKYDKKRPDGTQIRDWRRGCKVPEDLRAAFALGRDVENLETVAGLHVVASPYTPRLLPNAHMYQCDVRNWESQLMFSFGGWSHDEAWNTARNQVIANAATGLNDMENSPLFLWLPEDHKKNARNSLEHKWIGWKEGAKEKGCLVPTRRRNSWCLHDDVVHCCVCSMA